MYIPRLLPPISMLSIYKEVTVNHGEKEERGGEGGGEGQELTTQAGVLGVNSGAFHFPLFSS